MQTFQTPKILWQGSDKHCMKSHLLFYSELSSWLHLMLPTSWTGKDLNNWSSDMCPSQVCRSLLHSPQVTSFSIWRALTSLLTCPSHIPLVPWNSFDSFCHPPKCASQFGCILWDERIKNVYSIKMSAIYAFMRTYHGVLYFVLYFFPGNS